MRLAKAFRQAAARLDGRLPRDHARDGVPRDRTPPRSSARRCRDAIRPTSSCPREHDGHRAAPASLLHQLSEVRRSASSHGPSPASRTISAGGGNCLIDRDDAEQAIAAITALGRRVEECGVSAVIFPEGTRARHGELRTSNIGAPRRSSRAAADRDRPGHDRRASGVSCSGTSGPSLRRARPRPHRRADHAPPGEDHAQRSMTCARASPISCCCAASGRAHAAADGRPRTAYLVCTTPRTGSGLLGEALLKPPRGRGPARRATRRVVPRRRSPRAPRRGRRSPCAASCRRRRRRWASRRLAEPREIRGDPRPHFVDQRDVILAGPRAIGSPMRTRTRTPNGTGQKFRCMSRHEPSIVTGTIAVAGAAAKSATVPRCLNGFSSPWRARVPSGKITAETPRASTRRPSSAIAPTA